MSAIAPPLNPEHRNHMKFCFQIIGQKTKNDNLCRVSAIAPTLNTEHRTLKPHEILFPIVLFILFPIYGTTMAQTVSWESTSQTVDENSGTAITLTAVLDVAASATVVVPYSVGGTATQDVDYSLSGVSITIPAGDTSAFAAINLIDDTTYDPDETIEITMLSPVNATMGSPSDHTITVTDDESPPDFYAFWAVVSQDMSEDVGAVTLTVSLSATVSVPVTVDYSVNGTASGSGVDHDLVSGSIEIPADEPNGSVVFSVNDDTSTETDETIIVTITGVDSTANGSIGANDVFTGVIQDNDSQPQVSWDTSAQIVAEDAGTATLALTLTGAGTGTIRVPFTVGGSATAGSDHDLAADEIVVAEGETVAEYAFTIIDDETYEEYETITVTMGTPVGASTGDISEHTVTITDNDAAPFPEIYWTASTQTATEESGTISISVYLSAAGTDDALATFVVAGTADETDHLLVDGEITVPAGDTSATVTFDLVDDTVPEDDETIIITMEEVENAVLGSVVEHTVTITDGDDKPVVEWLSDSQTVKENAGASAIVAQLSFASGQDVSVPFTVGGTAAIDGTAHDLADGTVTILTGSTTGAVVFTPVDDGLPEYDETIIVTMGSTETAQIGTISVHTVTITDDDTAPQAQWGETSKSVDEDVGTVEITVNLSEAIEADASVPYLVTGTAEGDGVDHDLAEGALVIPAGDTSASVAVTIIDDAIAEPTETIIVAMGVTTNAVADESSMIISINDNDPDTTAPEITIVGDRAVTVRVGDVYEDAGATATDNVDGDLTSAIVTGSNVNTRYEGFYRVTYNAGDAAGNRAIQMDRMVMVYQATQMSPVGYAVDQSGRALADVTVSSDELADLATSDASGYFEYSPLYTTGKIYHLGFSKSGYATTAIRYSGSEALDAVVLISTEDTDYDFIGGTCRSYEGIAVQGAIVELDNSSYASATLTDADGNYLLAADKRAAPYNLKVYKTGYNTTEYQVSDATVDNDVTIVRKTGIVVDRPSTTEEHTEALGLDMVEIQVSAIPDFSGDENEIWVDPDAPDMVFSAGSYFIFHVPYESFDLEIRADTSADRSVSTGYYSSKEISFTAATADSPITTTVETHTVETGYPIIMRSLDTLSHVAVVIPVDGLQGEFIPETIEISITEYEDQVSDVVDGKIIEIEAIDEHGRELGTDPDDSENPLKELIVFMDYQAPVDKDRLKDGSDKILWALSATDLLNNAGTVVSDGQIVKVDETAVAFSMDRTSAYALKEQELVSTDSEKFCFIDSTVSRPGLRPRQFD